MIAHADQRDGLDPQGAAEPDPACRYFAGLPELEQAAEQSARR